MNGPSRTLLHRNLSGLLLLFPLWCPAAQLEVNRADPLCDDLTGSPAYCTITAAIADANGVDDNISIAAGTYTERLVISKDVGLQGAGAGVTIIDGAGGGRTIQIVNSVVELTDMTIENGNAGTSGLGGGILVDDGSNLTILDAIIRSNTAADGAGINVDGILTVFRTRITGNTADAGASESSGGGLRVSGTGWATITNSLIDNNAADVGGGVFNLNVAALSSTTVSGNAAIGGGGGLYNGSGSSATATLVNTTLTANTSTSGRGGIHNAQGIVTLDHSLIAGNAAAGSVQDCGVAFGASFLSSGHNFIGSISGCSFTGSTGDLLNLGASAAHLAPLADNGGPTLTHALLTGSAAIDAGHTGCAATDQRGVVRPIDGNGDGEATCDIGAFEAAAGTNSGDGGTSGGGGGGGGGSIDLALMLLAAGIGMRRLAPASCRRN